jgi:hypothetical protein
MASYSSPNIDTNRAGYNSHRNARNGAAPFKACTSAGTCILARPLKKLAQTQAACIATLINAADNAMAIVANAVDTAVAVATNAADTAVAVATNAADGVMNCTGVID